MKNVYLVVAALSVIIKGIAQEATVRLDTYITGRSNDRNGREIVSVDVPGKPPATYRVPIAIPLPDAVLLDSVPAFSWSFGCSSTAAAMAAGYYDNHEYPDMYTGPTNEGVMPMDNSCWGTVTINGETRNQCPLSATMLNLDGRTSRGHVDDYWIIYRNYGPDPFIVNGWPQHLHEGCTGDFMGTNQSLQGNADGTTRFYFIPDGSPLYDYTGDEPNRRDGCHGLRLFYESRGYAVTENFTQLIQGMYGNTVGFTFDQYREEIDNGRPVIIQLAGHSMLGFGYDDTCSIIYLHDTWDYDTHSMTWGGSYAGMAQWGVTVVRLESGNPPPLADFAGAPLGVMTGQSVSFTDLSMYNPDSWYWTFVGGIPASSSLQNPVITYNTPGVYTVTLTAINSNGYDTETKTDYITVVQPDTLSLKIFLEGIYNPVTGIMEKACGESGAVFPGTIADVIDIKLAEAVYPYSIVEGAPNTALHQDGSCNAVFSEDIDGEFFIVISHRNSVETWSSVPVSFNDSANQYDFTDQASKAYGNNLKSVSDVYCIYSGDINQDGIIDAGDLIAFDNLFSSFATGYLPEDVNGDGLIDSCDLIIIDNNSLIFIEKVIP